MANRKTGRRVNTPLFNWLEWLDKKAATLPRATNWVHDPFMLARYRNLRPLPIEGDVHSRIMCESGERTAARLFADWELRIADNTETTVCLEGLNAEQRRQLAALLLQTIVDLEMLTAADRSSQWSRHLRKAAATRLRVLNRKLQKARKAVQELKAYARDSETGNPDDALLHAARLLLGQDYRLAADNALKALAMKCPPKDQEFADIAGEYPTPERVEAFGMVQLYWFFRHGCNLSGDESEVRAARLRNAFWTEHGVSTVSYRAEYIPGESKGCNAVHTAVTRFKRNQGYQPNANSA